MRAQPKICYGLQRAMGMIGFVLAGQLAIWQSRTVLNIDLMAHSIREMSHREILVALACAFVAIFGAVIGQAVGSSIAVTDDRVSRATDAFWHFSANTTMIWTPTMIGLFAVTRGKEAAVGFQHAHSLSEQTWLAFGVPILLGCWLALIDLQALARSWMGCPLVILISSLSTFLGCGFVGVWEAQQLGMNPNWGWVMIIVPVFLIPATRNSMRQDAARRLAG